MTGIPMDPREIAQGVLAYLGETHPELSGDDALDDLLMVVASTALVHHYPLRLLQARLNYWHGAAMAHQLRLGVLPLGEPGDA